MFRSFTRSVADAATKELKSSSIFNYDADFDLISEAVIWYEKELVDSEKFTTLTHWVAKFQRTSTCASICQTIESGDVIQLFTACVFQVFT